MAGARLRGDRVAKLRKAAGWLQADLATQLGTRDRRVGEWERGEQQPQPRSVAELAAAFQIDALDLLDVDPDDPPLLALRLAAGLTLIEVADASGVPYSTYRRLEGGLVRGARDALVRRTRMRVVTSDAGDRPSGRDRSCTARRARADELLEGFGRGRFRWSAPLGHVSHHRPTFVLGLTKAANDTDKPQLPDHLGTDHQRDPDPVPGVFRDAHTSVEGIAK